MRKFMVIVDETPECQNAMRFAARRAQKTQGGVLMLYVLEHDDLNQHWMGVAEVMQAEARQAAEERLQDLAEELRALSGITPEFVIREGKRADEILKVIEEDPEIGVLVLGAGEGESPGPLVSHLVAKLGGRMRVPVTVVPGGLSLTRIDEIS